jgi:glycosyltransferase involved in cell wall biosynthesis
MLPRISIVTPCFNSEDYLEETINSVLDQNYSNLQYIIIDGGSQDRSPEIIKKYERYLDYWISEPDQGQSDAISKGLSRSDGDVFNWLNADDTYRPNALNIVGEYFMDPDINVLAGRSRIFGLTYEDRISSGTDIYPGNLLRTIGRARIDQPETFFRRSCIVSVGPINTNLHYLMDLELWLRYLLEYGMGNVRKIDDILVNFRLHSASKTINQPGGFQREGILLHSLFFDSRSRNIFPDLSKQLYEGLAEDELKRIRNELANYQYAISYAQRDWQAMSHWRSLLLSSLFFSISNLRIVELEMRRLIHSIISLSKR